MNDLMLSLVVLAIGGAAVWALVIYNRNSQMQQTGYFRQIAVRHGWEYRQVQEAFSMGYRYSGAWGQANWTFETMVRSTRGPDGRGFINHTVTRWWCEGVPLPGNMMLIGPRMLKSAAHQVGEADSQGTLHELLGDEAGSTPSMNELKVGSQALHKRYIIWAQTEEDAKKMLQSGVESALLGCPKQPYMVVEVGGKRLEIKVMEGPMLNQSQIESVVSLGERLIHVCQTAA